MKNASSTGINKLISIMLSFAMFIAPFTVLNPKIGVEAESRSGGFEKFPEYGNILINPTLQYSKDDKEIPNWFIVYSNSIAKPADGFKKADISLSESKYPGFRSINSSKERYYVGLENRGTDFKSKAVKTDVNGYSANSVVLYAQTIQLKPGAEYYYSSELSSSNGTSYGNMIVYPGDRYSGKGSQGERKYSVSDNDGISVKSNSFTAVGDGKVTFSIRHFVNQDPKTTLHIHRVGFFLKDDYEIQEEVKELFENTEFTSLSGLTTEEIQNKINEISTKVNSGKVDYSPDVKKYVNEQLNKAQELLDPAKTLENEINSKFKPNSETSAIEELTQDTIDKLRESVTEIKGSGLQSTLNKRVDILQAAYNLDQLKIEKSNELKDKESESSNIISELENLTDEEKEEFIDLLKQIQDTAVSDIYKANNTEEVMDVFEKAYQELEVKLEEAKLADRKVSAVKELKNKSEEAKKEIDNLPNLTDEERTNKKKEIDEAVRKGTETIQNQDSLDGLNNELDTAKTVIDGIVKDATLTNDKYEAIKELEKHAEDTKQQVDELKNVPSEKRDEAKEEIDRLLKEGIDKIKSSENIEYVDSNLAESKKEIDNVYDAIEDMNNKALEDAKDSAYARLDEAAAKAKETIDALENLSEEEKSTEKARVDAIVTEAKKAIETATSPKTITEITDQGISNIEKVVEEAEFKDSKNDAINQLKQKAEEVREKIATKPSLTQKQREAAEQEINKVLNEGIQRIEETKDMETLAVDLQTGKDELDAIDAKYELIDQENLNAAKEKAKSELDKKAEEANKEIDGLENLTDEEKQAKKDELAKQVEESKKAIDDATKPEEVEQALTEGKEAIDEIVKASQLDDQKAKAIKELEEKAKEIKDKIDNLEGVSEEQKEAAKNEIDQELAAGKENINSGTTVEEIDTSLTDSKDKMDDIYESIASENEKILEEKREESNTRLDEAAAKAKETIDALENLSEEEKTAEKARVDAIVTEAKKAIETATSPKTMTDITDQGILNIEKVVEEAEFKDSKNDAINQLKQKAEEVREKIANKPSLTQEQREAAEQEINKVLNEGIQRIEETKDMETLPVDLQTGKEELDAIDAKYELIDQENLNAEKEKAKSELDKKAEEANKEIDGLENLTDEEKQAKKDELAKQVEESKKAIDDATKPEEVEQALTEGKEAIDEIVKASQLDDQKAKAIKELKSKADELITQINKIEGISKTKKDELINKIKSELMKAIKHVNNSNSVKEVLVEKQKGIIEMERIFKGIKIDKNNLPATGMSSIIEIVGLSALILGMLLVGWISYYDKKNRNSFN